jgi:hypothetical protein
MSNKKSTIGVKYFSFFILIFSLTTGLRADFTRDNSTGIVTDNSTGLQWQDNNVGVTMSWQSAIDTCEALTLGGFDDWRLPNVNELENLVDDTRRNPAIDVSFQNTTSNYYWSSTSYVGYLNAAWVVGFHSDYQHNDNKNYNRYVRCVRDGQ